ncbi:replicative DNA helicase [Aliikangiella coralliicola]|uniref:Replicative DNA helicase n=1 Tax=Aliikangiella coralliicola TaxID=2592383 RepID=A0A545TW53_9GAMM|nr:replicative DNA helicase [Aliikangiella coralliicola]TQV81450.1 replicative DNA helicase [Aliikangiella coralliicola]
MLEDPQVNNIKMPPHSLEAEQSVLGGLLLDNESWEKVSEKLVPEDFYRKEHRLIFKAQRYLAENGRPMDVVTLYEFLEQEGEADDIGGLAYIADLAKNTPSASNIGAYADIVRERAVLREMISVSNEIADAAYFPKGRNSDQLLDMAEAKVFKIAEQRENNDGGLQIASTFLEETLDKIQFAVDSKGGITGLDTGFTDLNKKTNGLQNSDLIIVAGRPAMGKTTFAMNIAENISIHSGKSVLVFSMEMPANQLLMRSFASIGGIDATRLRTGALDDRDWDNLSVATNILKNSCKMYIDDSAGLSPSEVRSRSRRIMREHGDVGLVVIDYLQLMSVPGLSDNRTLEISEISRSLKALAKEMNIPVIALSQLNRSLEQRADRRPVMSDLRESGAIEQDADIIMFVYRDEVYNPETEDKGIGEVIIGKQRNGPIGSVRLAFQGHHNRFANLAANNFEEY